MNLLAGTLNENLGNIVTKLNELMDSFWLYIVLAREENERWEMCFWRRA